MHGPINVKSPNNTSKWQMGFNSAFKGLRVLGEKYGCFCCEDYRNVSVHRMDKMQRL
jgi:hypothetical protein